MDNGPLPPAPLPKGRLYLIIAAAVFVILLLIVVVLISAGQKKTAQNGAPTSDSRNSNFTTVPTTIPTITQGPGLNIFSGQNTTGIKFSTTQDYKNAYRVFPSSDDQTVRNAFDRAVETLPSVLQDGSVRVDFRSKLDPTFKIPSFIVKPGYSVYVVDIDFKSIQRFEDVGDDYFMLIDNNGVITSD